VINANTQPINSLSTAANHTFPPNQFIILRKHLSSSLLR
jgi:hypothetical protein